MKLTRLVSWFGANAANAEKPAELLYVCDFVVIPFAGSMCEVPHFRDSVQLLVSDKHEHLITLAKVVANRDAKDALARMLVDRLFHPAELEASLRLLRDLVVSRDGMFGGGSPVDPVDIAAAYFTASWMGRSAISGTRGELSTGLSLRYDAGGGDSVKRWRSACESLDAWHEALKRCAFTCESCFDVFERIYAKVTDAEFDRTAPGNKIGFYCDSPWKDDGEGYLFKFTRDDHRKLASCVTRLSDYCTVVMRFGVHPWVRELYPDWRWKWVPATGRTQEQKDKDEVFLVRGPEVSP